MAFPALPRSTRAKIASTTATAFASSRAASSSRSITAFAFTCRSKVRKLRPGGGFLQRFPDVTWDEGYTEAPDETAHGSYLHLMAWASPVTGQNPRLFNSGKQSRQYYERLWKTILFGNQWHGELVNRRKNGSTYHEEMTITPVDNHRGQTTHFIAIKQDVSDRKRGEAAVRESEELLRQVTDNIHEVFFATTPDTARVSYISPAYERIWGRPREEIYRQPSAWFDAVHPEDLKRVRGAFAKARRGLETDVEFRILRPDGSIRWIRNRTFPVADLEGRICRVVGLAEDPTERKRTEEELREAHGRLNWALAEAEQRARMNEKVTEMIDMIECCQSPEQAYKIAERALREIFDPCSGALCVISPSRDTVDVVAMWGEQLGTENVFRPEDCWALRRGKIHWAEDGESPLRCAHVTARAGYGSVCVPLAAQGETLGLLHLECNHGCPTVAGQQASDHRERLARRVAVVGERIALPLANLKLREILVYQSVRDPVTGLFNRRYMEESLDRDLSRAARRGDSLALAMCDLDHFKEFNDAFGHEAGDTVLREVAAVLRLRVRQGDVPCRFGGEEFVVVLPEANDETARERMESIRKEIESLNISHRVRTLGRVTISIGIALFPVDGASAEDLLRAADRALYQAKSDGRDRVVSLSGRT